jgi:polyhydroxyalkanoate synthase
MPSARKSPAPKRTASRSRAGANPPTRAPSPDAGSVTSQAARPAAAPATPAAEGLERAGYDPVALADSLASAAEKSAKLIGDFAARQSASGHTLMADELGIGKAFLELAGKMMANPLKLAESQMTLWWDYMSLWQASLMRMMGGPASPVAAPAKGDKRFRHEDWEQHFLFDYIKQSYLITARWLHDQVASVEGLDDKTRRKVDFYTRQYIDALSPSNFALTNPEVFRATVSSGGQNLVKGLNNLLDDIERGNGKLRISMTDPKAFELGVNIATTPGKVVFRNELMELIQYAPSTPKVWKRPLLIVPPWINKFYILDLREKNSLVKWCVDQGMTTFVVSWVNPDAKLADAGFERYLTDGTLAAMNAVRDATGEPDLNVVGYCLGGTLVAATLGYLAAKKDKRVASATFMTSLIDFRQTGELEVFIDEEQVASLERKMNDRGYLEGSEMANTFNMLRANDLIWSFVINNYLLGRDPFPFDLLHWNSDSTRMPARMHSFYLRNMYMKNALAKPCGVELSGVGIDLSKVSTPSYFVSAIEDHIAPWKATYAGWQAMKGPPRFVLSGSGHIAGMINPPAAQKYGYWTNEALPPDPDAWLAGAKQHEGSWWTDWREWLTPHLGKEVAARVPGRGKLKALDDAPGRYVRIRTDA